MLYLVLRTLRYGVNVVAEMFTVVFTYTEYTLRRRVYNCRFGSWMQSSDTVDLQESESDGLGSATDDYNADCPSVVQDRKSKRSVTSYECCENELYVDITINLQLAWRYSTH